MIDPVSAAALGALAGMTLTGAVIQIVSLNPARKLIAALEAEKARQRRVIEAWKDAFDILEAVAATSSRDVVSLLAQTKSQQDEIAYLKRADQPRNHGKFAPKLKVAA